MTILFLTPLFYPHIGGVEKHVLEVGKRLVKRGHRVIIITEKLNDPYQPWANSVKSMGEVFNIKIYRIASGRDNWFKKFRIWLNLWQKKDLIRKADIVHCHDVFFWYFPFRFIYPQKRVYTTFHGFEGVFPPSRRAIIVRKISEWISCEVICVGDYIEKWYGTKPRYVTYGGVNQIKNEKLKIKNKDKKLKILLIGRLEKDIGIKIYLRALEILKQKKVDFEFNVCGNGSLRKSVEEFGKVYGFVQNLNDYLQQADIVFASSYLSILEAMSNKKPVFSVYDNSLKKDYLRISPFSKWIIIEDSSKNLANRIKSFMENSNKAKINKAYEWANEQTWEKVTSEYLELYRS